MTGTTTEATKEDSSADKPIPEVVNGTTTDVPAPEIQPPAGQPDVNTALPTSTTTTAAEPNTPAKADDDLGNKGDEPAKVEPELKVQPELEQSEQSEPMEVEAPTGPSHEESDTKPQEDSAVTDGTDGGLSEEPTTKPKSPAPQVEGESSEVEVKAEDKVDNKTDVPEEDGEANPSMDVDEPKTEENPPVSLRF